MLEANPDLDRNMTNDGGIKYPLAPYIRLMKKASPAQTTFDNCVIQFLFLR